jgi:hypothetical protein
MDEGRWMKDDGRYNAPMLLLFSRHTPVDIYELELMI